MTWNELYRNFLVQTQALYEQGEADRIVSMIFESLADAPRAFIIRNTKEVVPKEIEVILLSALEKIKLNEPVQYIIGEAWFFNMKFKVGPEVLSPRPETEELVQSLLDLRLIKNSKVLDIGTGSGCIAIAIKKNAPAINVTAIDISSQALQIAKENAKKNDTDISFLQLDMLNESMWESLGQYDFIISNPPYIPEHERTLLDKNVSEYEPSLALFTPDDNPIIFYEKILKFSLTHLNKTGSIFMEVHDPFAEKIMNIYSQAGFETKIITDLFGKKRMIIANQYQ